MVKPGQGYINSFIVDSAERWGDYTSIQRSPIQPNHFWVSGSYGKSTNAVGTWLAEVAINDPSVGMSQINQTPIQTAYPNPVADLITIPYRCIEAATLELQISNALGQVVYTTSAQVEAGQHKAIVHLNDWSPGMYYYLLKSNQVLVLDGSFSKQ